MPTDLSIWTPNGPIVVGDGNAAYDAGNSGVFSASAINTGGWNSGADPFNQTSNYNPVVNIPDQVIGGGSQFGPSEAWNPGVGNAQVGVTPTNVMGPFDYMQPSGPTAGGRGGRENVGENEEYKDFMADRNASVNRNTNTNTNTSPSGSGGGGGGGYSGPAPIPSINISQDLAQRQQTGNIYAPDLSAYNDSSLFNYTGPGGLDEYTYGQNLPYQGAGYDIWGSPTDVANPYYEGQYAPLPTPVVTQPEPVGPADGAIGMSPVVMPPGIPPVSIQPPSSTNQPSMPGFTGSGTGGGASGGGTGPDGKDLTYQETIDYFGLTPQSTTFPSPGETIADKDYQDMLDKALAGTMDNQLQNQLDSSKPSQIMMDEQQNYEIDPYKGEAALNKDVVKTTLDESYPYVPSDDGNFNYMEDTLMAGGSPNGRGGFDLYYDRDDVPKMTLDPNNLESNYLARDIAGGMAKNQAELMAKGQFLQDKYDAQEAIQKKDNLFNQHFDRNQAEYKAPLFDGDPIQAAIDLEYPGAKQITDFADAIDGDTNAYKKILAQDGEISSGRGGIPVETPIISDGDSESTVEYVLPNGDITNDITTYRNAHTAALDKERYQTQINNPTADFSGTMKNYGSGFKSHEPQTRLSGVSSATPMQLAGSGSTLSGEQLNTRHPAYQAQLAREINEAENLFQNQDTQGLPPKLSDVTDAKPLGFADNAGQMESRNTNIFDDNRANSIFAKGPSEASTEIKSVFDEQQNYEVPASEMSPGEVGLTNGLIEGMEAMLGGAISVDGSGTDRVKSSGETQAWDKYYSYKEAGINALNKGDIDVKAFNELKGKAGSDTVIDHFVNKDTSPKINNFVSNSANLFYQAKDVLFGDDTIKEGITDYYQQMKGVNNDTKLGSIGEEIAKAKEATQQRKEVQENIFTPGPMKFAASASKPKVVVAKPKPKIKVNYNKNMPAKVVQTKPGKRGPQPAAPTRTTGSRGGRGSYSKPAATSRSPSYSVGQNVYRRVGGR